MFWDAASGTVRTAKTGLSGIRCLAFNPDGSLLASGSVDNVIQMWDVATGRERATLLGHVLAVNAIVFSSDGKTLASGSSDETIKLWDMELVLKEAARKRGKN